MENLEKQVQVTRRIIDRLLRRFYTTKNKEVKQLILKQVAFWATRIVKLKLISEKKLCENL